MPSFFANLELARRVATFRRVDAASRATVDQLAIVALAHTLFAIACSGIWTEGPRTFWLAGFYGHAYAVLVVLAFAYGAARMAGRPHAARKTALAGRRP